MRNYTSIAIAWMDTCELARSMVLVLVALNTTVSPTPGTPVGAQLVLDINMINMYQSSKCIIITNM